MKNLECFSEVQLNVVNQFVKRAKARKLKPSRNSNAKHPFEAAHSIGPKMVGYLAMIGVKQWSDLEGVDGAELAMRINIETGKKTMNRLGEEALENLVAYAKLMTPSD